MIVPDAVDLQVGARITFALETQTSQQGSTAQVVGEMIGHDAVQSLMRKHMLYASLHGFIHIALTLMILRDGIAEVAGLKSAAHDIAEVADADHFVLLAHGEIHADTGFHLAEVLEQAFLAFFQRKIIGVARRFPRCQMRPVVEQIALQAFCVFWHQNPQLQSFGGQGVDQHGKEMKSATQVG